MPEVITSHDSIDDRVDSATDVVDSTIRRHRIKFDLDQVLPADCDDIRFRKQTTTYEIFYEYEVTSRVNGKVTRTIKDNFYLGPERKGRVDCHFYATPVTKALEMNGQIHTCGDPINIEDGVFTSPRFMKGAKVMPMSQVEPFFADLLRSSLDQLRPQDRDDMKMVLERYFIDFSQNGNGKH